MSTEKLREALEGLMALESRGRIMPIGKEWDAAREALAQPSPPSDTGSQNLLMRLASIAAECSDQDTTDALDALISSYPAQPSPPSDHIPDTGKMVERAGLVSTMKPIAWLAAKETFSGSKLVAHDHPVSGSKPVVLLDDVAKALAAQPATAQVVQEALSTTAEKRLRSLMAAVNRLAKAHPHD